jgi:hypothetical protein
MNEITIRLYTEKDKIDPLFFENLVELVEQYGMSMANQPSLDMSEMRKLSGLPTLDREEFIRETESLSKQIGPIQSDSAVDIREIRDNR